VLTSKDSDEMEVPVPFLAPRVRILGPETIAGFGLGVGTLSIQRPAGLRGYLKEVVLSTSRGNLDPTPVKLRDTGSGEAELRSSGLGEARITLVSGQFVADEVVVHFTFPWSFLVAIVIGALIGGGLWTKGNGTGGFVAGLLGGFVTGLLACIGISVAGIDLGDYATETIAAIGAALPGYRAIWPKTE
jgi:hypothetical protein